jgi:hypothetical protein
LVGCAPAPKLAEPAQQGQSQQGQSRQPSYDHAAAHADGYQLWRIAPQQSLISITVRRSGTLARLGHDHVVASRNVNGYAMRRPAGATPSGTSTSSPFWGEADLAFRVDELSVDEAPLRALAGFDTQPSQDAIDGTRRNMLTRVLDAERFPLVAIHARLLGPVGSANKATNTDSGNGSGNSAVELTITLRGVTRKVDTVADINIDASTDTIKINGLLNLKQSDFGIVPFSVLGGAIAVADQLELQYRIVAEVEADSDSDSDSEPESD